MDDELPYRWAHDTDTHDRYDVSSERSETFNRNQHMPEWVKNTTMHRAEPSNSDQIESWCLLWESNRLEKKLISPSALNHNGPEIIYPTKKLTQLETRLSVSGSSSRWLFSGMRMCRKQRDARANVLNQKKPQQSEWLHNEAKAGEETESPRSGKKKLQKNSSFLRACEASSYHPSGRTVGKLCKLFYFSFLHLRAVELATHCEDRLDALRSALRSASLQAWYCRINSIW